MKILAIISGEYGRRNVENIRARAPKDWEISIFQAPLIIPPVIDYPEDYVPASLPGVDLILSFAENRGVAELIPEIADRTNAKAVIASIDNEAWLPTGLARQLSEWLARLNVACATPKPLCSLTEKDYGIARGKKLPHGSEIIAEFARYFGHPDINLQIDLDTNEVISVVVQRDAVCGCAHFVAEKLIGLKAEDVLEKAGLLHHHYPCLASMVKLPDFNKDTLMHESGNLLKDNLRPQVKPHIHNQYIKPDGHKND